MPGRLLRFTPAAGVFCLAASCFAADSDCKPVFEAMDKVTATPTRIFSTTKKAGKPETSEVLYNGDVIYSKEKDKWSRSPVSVQQVAKQEKENRTNSKFTCRYVKDETIDGEQAAVYTTHSESAEEKSDGQLSISKDNGLPLRNEIDVDLGKNGGKSHHSVRYDYKNISPPPM